VLAGCRNTATHREPIKKALFLAQFLRESILSLLRVCQVLAHCGRM
jgi:hypothetical protein